MCYTLIFGEEDFNIRRILLELQKTKTKKKKKRKEKGSTNLYLHNMNNKTKEVIAKSILIKDSKIFSI